MWLFLLVSELVAGLIHLYYYHHLSVYCQEKSFGEEISRLKKVAWNIISSGKVVEVLLLLLVEVVATAATAVVVVVVIMVQVVLVLVDVS